MRPVSRRLLRQSAVLTLAIAVASCTQDNDPLQPPLRALFTTPTGLVTANPPEIFVGAGDIGTCNSNNDEATAKILDTIPGTVFVLGDNVYENGTNSEFNNCYHPTWGRHKARTKPSAGNHEYNTSGATGYYNYFGAAAGDRTKGYYSFALGAWHVIVLNSNISMSATSAQTTWLKADLAAHSNLCTVAYWHHPLYSSTGGSGSGGVTYSSVRPLVDALYAGGADLILAGHRHFYDRLAPIKPNGTRDDAFGVRHIVAGMGGKSGGTVTNRFPTSEVRNGDTFGVLKLYLYEDSYAWKFIPVAGKTFTDSGSTACHGVPGGPPPPPGGVSASRSTVSAAPATITAGGSGSTITVTARDANGNPVSGATVVLAASGSLNTLTQPAGPTGADGVATGSLRSNVAQEKIVSATINDVPITQTDTVTVVPGPARSMAIEAGDGQTAPAGSAVAIAPAVHVADEFDNSVAGVSVSFAVTSGGGTVHPSAVTTDAHGVAAVTSWTLGRTAGPNTLTATADGLSGSPVTFTAVGTAGVSSMASHSGDNQSATVGTAVAIPPAVIVRDVFDNPVAGVPVTFAIASGAGSVDPTTPVTTDANGIAAVTSWTLGPSAGTNTLTATSDGVTGSPVTFTATATVPPQDITHTLLTAGINIVNQKVYPTPAIAPVPNTLITVAVLGHSSLGTPPIPTLSGGGMTAWQVVASIPFDPGTAPLRRLTIFRAMSATPGSGPITITSSMTLSHAQWIVSQWDGVDQSGANGAGAIGQTGSTTGEAATGLTVSLAAFGNSKNVAYGAFGVRSQVLAVTPGAGFTEISEVPSGESTPGDLQAEWAANLNAIRATWTNLNGGALGVEIKARAAP